MKEQILKLNNEDTKKNIFWAVFALTFFSMSLYVYFITSTIRNVVYMEDMDVYSGELALEIGGKEFDFINLKNSVTLSLAQSKGFSEVKEKIYITPDSLGFAKKSTNEI